MTYTRTFTKGDLARANIDALWRWWRTLSREEHIAAIMSGEHRTAINALLANSIATDIMDNPSGDWPNQTLRYPDGR